MNNHVHALFCVEVFMRHMYSFIHSFVPNTAHLFLENRKDVKGDGVADGARDREHRQNGN